MRHYHSYLRSSVQILEQYRGEEPFSNFLKTFFSANKKFGSTDRKHVTQLCYCFFRTGKSAPGLTKEERILLGLFLFSTEPNDILNDLRPEWNEKASLSLEEKENFLTTLYPLDIKDEFILDQVFPWPGELSTGIDHLAFCKSFFIQPGLFLRSRPGKKNLILEKLEKEGIASEVMSNTIILPNLSKISALLDLDREAVVQDLNSQRTGEFFPLPGAHTVWDCCAGSGGKSIMAFDMDPTIELTVSDKRESILANLKKRFKQAGIKKYKSFVADLTEKPSEKAGDYDLIICDAPCTGSGTWGRTPEQLFYFDFEKVKTYATLQRKILSHIYGNLRPGGQIVYITCSVFRKENEEVVEFMQNALKLEIVRMETLVGYDKKADSMFVCQSKK